MVPQQADTARTMRERFEKINQSPHADKQGLREDPRVHHQNKLKIISIIPQAQAIHTYIQCVCLASHNVYACCCWSCVYDSATLCVSSVLRAGAMDSLIVNCA